MPGQGFFNFIMFNALLAFVVLSAVILWRKPAAWIHLFALFLGIVVGWLDLKVTEVSPSVLLLITFGMFLGFEQPKRFWLWAVYLGMWVPTLALLSAMLHLATPTSVELVTSLLALVLAGAGAGIGALLRRFATPVQA